MQLHPSTPALLLASILSTGAVAAPQVPPTADLPPAAEILDRHVEATGGKQAHLKITSRKQSGTLEISMAGHELKAEVVMQAQAPNKSHLLLQGEHLNMVRVCDGKHVWEWNGGHDDGRDEESEDDKAKEDTHFLEGAEAQRILELSQFHLAVNWRQHYAKAETVAIEKIGEAPAYKVRLQVKGGTAFHRFFDQESGRLVQETRESELGHMGKTQLASSYLDYKKFDGVWLPTKIATVLDSKTFGKGTQTFTFAKIQHDVKIPAKLFEMPAELKKSLAKKSEVQK